MEKLFLTVFHMSMAASFCMGIVLLLRLALKRAPKRFSYFLWLVVFVRLVFPWSISSDISLIPESLNEITMLTSVRGEVREEGPLEIEISLEQSAAAGSQGDVQGPRQSEQRSVWQIVSSSINGVWIKYQSVIVFGAGVAWLCGICLIFSLQLRDVFRVRRSVKRHIICHEQIHIRQKDYLIKAAAFLITGIHWFNPLVWLAFYLMSRDMEMSCEEKQKGQCGWHLAGGM